MLRFALAVAAIVLGCATADAALVASTAKFLHGDKDMLGLLAYDDSRPEPRPGVLLLHGWSGPENYVKGRAEELARLGFVAFAADIYRRGEKPRTPSELLVDARNFKRNRTLFQARALSALELLQKQPQVDAGRIAVVGYGFSGLIAYDLACATSGVQGSVLLDVPPDQDLATAAGCGVRLLVLQGGAAPETARLAALLQQLPAGGDWQATFYGGAGAGFTDPSRSHNATADRRAWTALRQFLDELFGRGARQ